MTQKLCECQSGKPFQRCCEPLLSGLKVAKTPVQLMRSRYTAYALGGYGEYLLLTWLPTMTGGLNAANLSQRSSEWVGLDVLNKAQKGDEATVEFKAYYLGDDGSRQTHHEKSVFQRVKGRWLYVGVLTE